MCVCGGGGDSSLLAYRRIQNHIFFKNWLLFKDFFVLALDFLNVTGEKNDVLG